MRSRPNILFFLTDDQRFDTIHALGNERMSTPTMDWLVENGTSFVHAHIMGGSSGAVCMPSRAMIHTGRSLYQILGAGETIAEDQALLGETLLGAGYNCLGIGKWHNSPRAFARSFNAGAEISFYGMVDHWNVPVCHFDPTGAYDTHRPLCRDPHHSNAVSYDLCDHLVPGKHSSELYCNAAVKYINEYTDDKPFLLYVAFNAPHDPRTMPRQYLNLYPPDTMELPPNFMGGHPFDNGELYVRDERLEQWPRTDTRIRTHIAEYYGMITHADAQMGRVLAALRERGMLDNTLVVLAGDNGLALGQHGLMGKQNLYDHSVRVPLVMAGPGIPNDERREAFTYLHDIFPTLCDAAGVGIPHGVEGVSLTPAFTDSGFAPREYLHLAYRHVQRAVRDSRYKLIEYAVEGGGTTQLFDMAEDPYELHNLANDPAFGEVLSRLRRELGRWRTELGDTGDQGQRFWTEYERRCAV
jgi:arylsulfatase A-like enzyme